ncbi:MAG: DUF2059 domain-containing protein [Halioglobus sp.]|nr:DUF2059 domain-containing protein [Halioglobus sp.]
MNLLKVAFFTAALATGSVALADTPPAENAESLQEAEELLELMGMEAALDQSISQMRDAQLQQNPGMAPYEGVMMAFFNKYTSYASLKQEMAQATAEAFTLAELQEITAFYSSDVGQKVVQKMPQLMAQGAQLGMSRLQDNVGELQESIKAEAERNQESPAQ